jgi:prevent-host-death family protein
LIKRFEGYIMTNLENVRTLSDFERNAKDFVEQIKATKAPLVLTVNGEAEVVVQDAGAFQEMVDRLQQAESELRQLKLETLRRDVAVGVEQMRDGAYTEYDDESLPSLLETIKTRGQQRLEDDRR